MARLACDFSPDETPIQSRVGFYELYDKTELRLICVSLFSVDVSSVDAGVLCKGFGNTDIRDCGTFRFFRSFCAVRNGGSHSLCQVVPARYEKECKKISGEKINTEDNNLITK